VRSKHEALLVPGPALEVPFGGEPRPARIFEGRLPAEGGLPAGARRAAGERLPASGTAAAGRAGGRGAGSLRVHFIDAPEYFDREGIYTEPKTGKAYEDDGERFAFFSLAVLAALRALGLRPDAIHANDYQTGLVAAALRHRPPADGFFRGTGTVYTIHNMGYQGVFDLSVARKAGFGEDVLHPTGPLEFWGKTNFMKAGIVASDLVNTVSRKYAEEIRTSAEYGFGLEGVLDARRDRLFGIVNGIDGEIWNPETDPKIPHHFTAESLSGKARMKDALLEECGFSASVREKPLFGVISRLADQKGFDLVREAAPDLLRESLALVVLGTGQPEYHELFRKLERESDGRVRFFQRFDDGLAHRIEAGSDFFLMPSRYEPCGLNQLYSLRYGTIPVVRATGGLADTVVPVDRDRGTGTGIRFEEYSARALLGAVREAVALHADPALTARIRRNGMRADFSWERSASEYEELYRSAAALARA
jgi:starch synthase